MSWTLVIGIPGSSLFYIYWFIYHISKSSISIPSCHPLKFLYFIMVWTLEMTNKRLESKITRDKNHNSAQNTTSYVSWHGLTVILFHIVNKIKIYLSKAKHPSATKTETIQSPCPNKKTNESIHTNIYKTQGCLQVRVKKSKMGHSKLNPFLAVFY